MTTRMSLATSLVAGLTLAASAAVAGPPDPTRSSVPAWIPVVGRVNGGANPDPAGLISVITRDWANNPTSGVTVRLDFSACCDIVLCDAGVGHDCAARTVTGITNGIGQVSFTVLGAARDPGDRVPPNQYGGCGLDGIRVWANGGTGDVLLGGSTAVTLDLNGAAGGSNGTSGSDVSNLIQLVGSVMLGAPYRGRGDFDNDRQLSGADVAALLAHFGRLSLAGAVGCTGAFCAGAACP